MTASISGVVYLSAAGSPAAVQPVCAAQAILLARIQAIMAGDKQLANRLFMPAKMQAQAVKYALLPTSLHLHCVMSRNREPPNNKKNACRRTVS